MKCFSYRTSQSLCASTVSILLNVQSYGGIVFANVPTKKLQAWCKCDWPPYHTYVIAAKQAQAILTKLQSGTNDYSYIVMWWILLILAHHPYKTHNQFVPDFDSLPSNFANKLLILILNCLMWSSRNFGE